MLRNFPRVNKPISDLLKSLPLSLKSGRLKNTPFSRYPVRVHRKKWDTPTSCWWTGNNLTKQRLLSGFLPQFAYFHGEVSLLATQERADQMCRLHVKRSMRLTINAPVASHAFDASLSSINSVICILAECKLSCIAVIVVSFINKKYF